MEFTLDNFNGIIIDSSTISNTRAAFKSELASVLSYSSDNGKNIIWLTLPIEHSQLISEATALGFVFHNCLETEITLIHKPKTDTFVPFIPTHTIGAGALIMNSNKQILLVKEHGMKGFKLPGGHVELGEPIGQSVVREVWEETGVVATFDSIVGMTTKHPFRFGKSNIYFVCKLTATKETIDIQDEHEIAEAKWFPFQDYLDDEASSLFNRQLVKSLVGKAGLTSVELSSNKGPHQKQEVFFS